LKCGENVGRAKARSAVPAATKIGNGGHALRALPARRSFRALRHDSICLRCPAMKRSALRPILATVVLLLCADSVLVAANAADPSGVWHTQGRLAQVKIAKCAADFCGTIIALKDPIDPATGNPQADSENEDVAKRDRPVIGIQVVIGMKPAGANKWSGQLYSPEEGKSVSGNLVLKDADTLSVEGCLLGGLLCRSETWIRVK
jgi:uncharacterized protein (DUF2147 family)